MNNLRQILEKVKYTQCCSSCIEDKQMGYGDDIDGCCCRHISVEEALESLTQLRRKELEGAKEDAATLRRRIKALEMDSYNKDFLRVFRRIADRLDKEAIGNYPIRR